MDIPVLEIYHYNLRLRINLYSTGAFISNEKSKISRETSRYLGYSVCGENQSPAQDHHLWCRTGRACDSNSTRSSGRSSHRLRASGKTRRGSTSHSSGLVAISDLTLARLVLEYRYLQTHADFYSNSVWGRISRAKLSKLKVSFSDVGKMEKLLVIQSSYPTFGIHLGLRIMLFIELTSTMPCTSGHLS